MMSKSLSNAKHSRMFTGAKTFDINENSPIYLLPMKSSQFVYVELKYYTIS